MDMTGVIFLKDNTGWALTSLGIMNLEVSLPENAAHTHKINK